MKGDYSKYPNPMPDQHNANHNHGTGMDQERSPKHRGTMGTRTGVYGGMGGKGNNKMKKSSGY